MITKDQIAAALRKLGPSTPAALATELDATRNTLQYHLKAMLADKAVHAAGNRLNRVVALPDQKIEGAPPPEPKAAAAQEEEQRHRQEDEACATRRADLHAGGGIHPGDRRRVPAGVHQRRGRAHRLLRGADPAHRHASPEAFRGLT